MGGADRLHLMVGPWNFLHLKPWLRGKEGGLI